MAAAAAIEAGASRAGVAARRYHLQRMSSLNHFFEIFS
jgi:hypothetical protein